jgi:hypothetical protein
MYKMNEPSILVKMAYEYDDDEEQQQQQQQVTMISGGGTLRRRRRKKKNFSTCASVKARLNARGVWCVPNAKYVPAKKLNKGGLTLFNAWNQFFGKQPTAQGRPRVVTTPLTYEQWSWFAMLGLSGIAAATSIFNLLSETGYF